MTVATEHAWLRETSAQALFWQNFELTFGADYRAIEAEWKALESLDTASIFQSHAFVDAWLRTAEVEGETPLIVTGRQGGALRLVLPLALTRRSGLVVMTWLAQSHANYGMGLIEPDTLGALDPAQAEDLMKEIARHCGADVVHLDNQPARWAGQANPFALGRSARLTANDTFVVPLADDLPAQHRGLFSGRTMSGLKRKQRRLEEAGSVSFDPPQSPEERLAVIDWFIAEKRKRLAEEGQTSVFDRQDVGDLYRQLAANCAGFDIERLAVDGAPIAVALTMRCGRIAYLLNTAYSGADFARFSPGALLLHHHVAAMHAKGVRTFDFGPGALPYKLEWQPEQIPLVASTFAMSALGRPITLLLGLGVTTKCAVKRNDPLREMIFALRRLGRGAR